MPFILYLLAALAHLTRACQREPRNRDHSHQYQSNLAPRQDIQFPPVWTKEEFILHTSFSNTELDTWSSYYTHRNHIAGKNKSMAEDTAKKWTDNGVPSSLVKYEVLLDYPVEQALVLKWPNGNTYEVQMYEDVLDEDKTTGYEGQTPGFHGYSASGKVEAEYVYIG